MKKKTLPIYDINQFQYLGKESDFYANTFTAHLKQHSDMVLEPHKHNFYLSVLFTRGKGTHEIEFNTYDVRPGKIFMIAPGQVHNWQFPKDTNGYIFFHTKEFFNLNFTNEKVENYPFFFSIRNSPEIVVKKAAFKKIEEAYREIVEEYHQDQLMKFQKILSLVNVLYITLSRQYISQTLKESRNLNYLSRIQGLESLIDEHFRKTKSPKEYAQMMNMSEKHLNRICKISLNKTLSEIIMDRVILESKRMLVYSKSNISEIANELGYTDNSYFSRLFKKKTGQAPLEFINQFRL
jgi:AraC family transcriptional regulator, transcriptional activator of pobA